MKKPFVLFVLLMGLAAFASTAKAQHTVKLSWTASADTPNTNVYRNPGACPTTPNGFTKLTSVPVTVAAFTDSAPVIGLSCYYVTAFVNGLESAPSSTVQVSLPPAAPTNLQVASVAGTMPDKPPVTGQ